MDESVSGVKVRGTWADIVEHGESITRALRDARTHTASGKPSSNYPDAFAEWDEWRPKPHEHIEDDISEKIAEQASVDEGTGEKVGESPTEDMQTAGEKLTESSEELEEDGDESPTDKASESMELAVPCPRSYGGAVRVLDHRVDGLTDRPLIVKLIVDGPPRTCKDPSLINEDLCGLFQTLDLV